MSSETPHPQTHTHTPHKQGLLFYTPLRRIYAMCTAAKGYGECWLYVVYMKKDICHLEMRWGHILNGWVWPRDCMWWRKYVDLVSRIEIERFGFQNWNWNRIEIEIDLHSETKKRLTIKIEKTGRLSSFEVKWNCVGPSQDCLPANLWFLCSFNVIFVSF